MSGRPTLDAAVTARVLFRAGWSLVRGLDEPGFYEADTSSDGYYLNLLTEGDVD